MKIGYRTNIESVKEMDLNVYPSNKFTSFWGLTKPTYSANENWNGTVVDLSTYVKLYGNNDAVDAEKFTEFFGNNAYMQQMLIKPYRRAGSAIKVGEYFDIQYVGFFKDKAEADAYTLEKSASVDPELLFDAKSNGITAGNHNKLTVTSVDEVTATLTPTPAYIKYLTNDETKNDEDGEVMVNLDTGLYPDGAKASDYPYMRIGVRTDCAQTILDTTFIYSVRFSLIINNFLSKFSKSNFTFFNKSTSNFLRFSFLHFLINFFTCFSIETSTFIIDITLTNPSI